MVDEGKEAAKYGATWKDFWYDLRKVCYNSGEPREVSAFELG